MMIVTKWFAVIFLLTHVPILLRLCRKTKESFRGHSRNHTMLSVTFFFLVLFESVKGLELINYISAKQHDISKAGSVHNISQISTAKKVKCQSRGKLNNFFFLSNLR